MKGVNAAIVICLGYMNRNLEAKIKDYGLLFQNVKGMHHNSVTDA